MKFFCHTYRFSLCGTLTFFGPFLLDTEIPIIVSLWLHLEMDIKACSKLLDLRGNMNELAALVHKFLLLVAALVHKLLLLRATMKFLIITSGKTIENKRLSK